MTDKWGKPEELPIPDSQGTGYKIINGILYTTEYLHGSNDKYEWLEDEEGNLLYSDDIIAAFDSILYEVRADIVFDLRTGEHTVSYS